MEPVEEVQAIALLVNSLEIINIMIEEYYRWRIEDPIQVVLNFSFAILEITHLI